MRIAARMLYGLLGVVVPTVISACYGVPYSYSRTGRVVNAATGKGIEGIQVSCMRQGAPYDSTYSDLEGRFDVFYDIPCDELEFEDVDGSDNGRYRDRSAEFCENCPGDIVVEMSPEN